MEKPICGSTIRLQSLKDELYSHLNNYFNGVEKKEIVGWYMLCGLERGFSIDILLRNIGGDIELFDIIRLLTVEEILRGKKPPNLRKSDEVEVIVNAKNITYHRGIICELQWHVNEKEWFYHIFENGKKVGKRYYEKDLNLINKAGNVKRN